MTKNDVNLDDLEACQHLKKKENVIIKFKKRKLRYKGQLRKLRYKIINNWKTMNNESKELYELIFQIVYNF